MGPCGLFLVTRELSAVAEAVPTGRELRVLHRFFFYFLFTEVLELPLVLLDRLVVKLAVFAVPISIFFSLFSLLSLLSLLVLVLK